MTENFKIVGECRRLEANMNVHAVDNNLHGRTLIIQNIYYDIRHKQIDNQISRGQKPNIPSRPYTLRINSKVIISDILTHLPSTKDMTIGNTFRQECM